jgi:hypothetical protein
VQPQQLAEQRPIAHCVVVRGHRVDLVERQPVAEQLARLPELAPEGTDGVVLHLVDVDVHPPAAGVDVAPLGSHGQRTEGDVTAAQPGAEKGLRQPVRPGDVDITHAGLVRGVQHLVAPPFHLRDAAVRPEILITASGDVGRPAECGQPEPDSRGDLPLIHPRFSLRRPTVADTVRSLVDHPPDDRPGGWGGMEVRVRRPRDLV